MTVLLVDVANTVGARPDGWWRDRVGATARLLAALSGLPGRTVIGPEGAAMLVAGVVAVVEGQARDVEAPAGLRLVRAPGSGDDALADTAGELGGGEHPVLVVTADRGLRARLPAGCRVTGPSWLRDRLDALTSAS